MTENRATDERPPFFSIEEAVIDDYELDPLAGWLYVVIVRHINRKKNDAFPSVSTLAQIARMSKASVLRYTKQLEEKQLIKVVRDTDPNTQEKSVNHYKLLSATRVVSDSNQGSDYTQLGVVSDSDINQKNINQMNLTKEEQEHAPESEIQTPETLQPPSKENLRIVKSASDHPSTPISAPPPSSRARFTLQVFGGQDYYADGEAVKVDSTVFIDACNAIFYGWLDALDTLGRKPDTSPRDLWAKHREAIKALAINQRTPEQVRAFVAYAYSDRYTDKFYSSRTTPITLAAVAGAIGTWLTQQAATSARSASAQTANTLPAAVRRSPEEIEQLKRDKENILAEIKQESA